MPQTLRPAPIARSLALAFALLLAGAAAAHAAPQSRTFLYTGAPQQFHVPEGVETVQVVAIGGHGGHALRTAPGGAGGRVSGTIAVKGGDVLDIYVGGYGGRNGGWGWATGGAGGASASGHDARGGGGASAVVVGGETPFVAGGGGGGGADAAGDTFHAYGGHGGAGGSARDGAAHNGGHSDSDDSGGCGGCKPTRNGDAGSDTNALFNGGGGGAGGGHAGGRGGDAGIAGGGGGGGSSAVSSAVQQPAYGVGPVDCTCSGTVTLTWALPDPGRIAAYGPSTPQTTTVFTPFGAPLQARVTDADGRPLAGQTVQFDLPEAVPSGGFQGLEDPFRVEAVTDANGVATSPTVVAGPGVGTWTALAFVGDLSTSFSLTNAPVRTATTVTSTASPSRVGEAVRFRATVTAASGAAGSSGQVQFIVDDAPVGGPVPLAGGQALSPPVDALGVGRHEVVASYSDAGGLLEPSEGTLDQVVEPAQTHVALTASDTTVGVGDPVTAEAHVTAVAPGAGTPDGDVELRLDGALLATVPLDGDGRASTTFSPAAAGAHALEARYVPAGPTPSFEASDAELGLAVGPAASATTLTSSADPAEFGAPLTLTARVVATDVLAPTGTVTFTRGTSVLCADVPLAVAGGAAEATCPVAGGILPVGDLTIVAAYAGDAGASSGRLTQHVAKAATTTALTATPEPSGAGEQIALRADVSRRHPGTIHPGGLVRFRLDGEAIGAPATIDGSGAAEMVVTDPPPAGSMALFEAEYLGDASFAASSDAAAHRVRRATTTLTLDSSADPAAVGLPVRFTAALPAGATGTVAFHVDGAPLGLPVVVDADGRATSPPAELPPGEHEVLATYAGDDRHERTSATLRQTVVPTPFAEPEGPLVPVVPVLPDVPDADPPPVAERCAAVPVLTALHRRGRAVRIHGWAGSDRAGETVTILAGRRAVAETTVGSDGLFRASARVARRHDDDRRYRARVGTQESAAAALRRPIVVTRKAARADGPLVVRGRAARRLGRRLEVQRAPLCAADGAPTTVARTRASAKGRFRVSVARSGEGVALYTVRARGGRASLPFLATR